MGILIVLFILLFLLLLLSAPLIVEARARLSLRGAVVMGRVYFLGLIPIPVRLYLHLFSAPYFTLKIGKRYVPLFRKRNGRKKERSRRVRLLRLDTKTTVGIEGEPAQAVLLAGSIAVLLSMLIPRIAENGSARAGLSNASLLRISAKAQAIVEPVPLVWGIVRAAYSTAKSGKQ